MRKPQLYSGCSRNRRVNTNQCINYYCLRFYKDPTNNLHPEVNNIPSASQHGFRSGRSVDTNLIQTYKLVTTLINKSLPVDMILLDLSKGFDKVCHEFLIIKQFVVTNCSKEQPGSIVNETVKNGILIARDTSKESDSYADFKYISFIKFSLCHQKLQA